MDGEDQKRHFSISKSSGSRPGSEPGVLDPVQFEPRTNNEPLCAWLYHFTMSSAAGDRRSCHQEACTDSFSPKLRRTVAPPCGHYLEVQAAATATASLSRLRAKRWLRKSSWPFGSRRLSRASRRWLFSKTCRGSRRISDVTTATPTSKSKTIFLKNQNFTHEI